MQKNLKIEIIKYCVIAVILLLAIIVWNSPIVFKGYAENPGEVNNLIIARNLVKTGKFSSESDKNVILSSELIKEKGVTSSRGEKFIAIISSGIYKITGIPNYNKADLISSIVSAIALLFFVLMVWELFDFKTSVIFSLIYILLPTVWQTSIQSNFYEYSFLFLAIGLYLFFLKQDKYTGIKNIFSGIFLAFAFLSRDAMGLLFPALLIWMWFYRRKQIIPLFSALIVTILFFSVYFQLTYGKSSNYHFAFFGKGDEVAKSSDFFFYAHLYPDPYTYFYDKEEYLKNLVSVKNAGGYFDKVNLSKRISNVEAKQATFSDRLINFPVLIAKHLTSIMSIQYVGGPLMFLLFLLGLLTLKKEKKYLFDFITVWLGVVFFILSFVVLAQRNHTMDIMSVFALGVAVGIISLAKVLEEKMQIRGNKAFTLAIIIFFVAYSLLLTNHVAFSQAYKGEVNAMQNAYAEKIKSSGVNKDDIIAVPLDTNLMYSLNYMTDKSLVKFSEDTIVKLIKEKKLDEAFKMFGVTKILGYSQDVTKKITDDIDVKNITDNNIKLTVTKSSNIKSLLSNLIK